MNCEYTVYDAKKQQFILVSAEGWREAIKKAYETDGVVPRRHLDVRPRTGTCPAVIDGDKFDSFMSKHF